MGSEPEVVELSSSDEAENDDLMCVSGMDLSKRPHDLMGNDDDDVVIVEKSQCTSTRTRGRSTNKLEDDDDCCVVVETPDTKVEVLHADVEELVVTGESGPVACRDFPHARHLCVRFPFQDTPHEEYCEQCHCFVCDKLAPCGSWVTHCHASDKEETWKVLRKSNKSPELALLSTVAQAGLIPPCTVPLPTTRPRTSAAVRSRPTLSHPACSSPPVTMSEIARSLARQSSTNICRSRFYPQGTGTRLSSTSTTAPAAAVQTNTYIRPPMTDIRPREPIIRFASDGRPAKQIRPPTSDVRPAKQIRPPTSDVTPASHIRPPTSGVTPANHIRPPTSDVRPANHIRPPAPNLTTRQNGSMCANFQPPTGPIRIKVRGNSPAAVPCPQAKLKVLLSNHANQKVRVKKQARSASKGARTFVHGQHGLNAQVNITSSGFSSVSVPQCSVSMVPPFGSMVPAPPLPNLTPPTVRADSSLPTVLPTTAPASVIANSNGGTEGFLFSGERNMALQENDGPEDTAETDKYFADLRALFELNQA